MARTEWGKCGEQKLVLMIVFMDLREILFLICGEQNLIGWSRETKSSSEKAPTWTAGST